MPHDHLVFATLLAAAIAAADPDAAIVAKAFPAGDGLAVQVGAGDPAFLAGLTNQGRRLVHALTLADAERDRLRAALIAAKVHPLAATATWIGAPRLPYADRLVNLLVLDRDALGARAPAAAECLRVLAPEGVLLERVSGSWKTTAAPRPAAFGSWTHFDGYANGNSVGDDTAVDGLRALQWIDNAIKPRWWKNGPRGGDDGNMVVVGRHLIIDRMDGPELPVEGQPHARAEPPQLECRDASNGLLLWALPRSPGTANKRWTMAACEGKVLTWLQDGGPLVAIDIATGREAVTFPGGEIKEWQTRHAEGSLGPKTKAMQGMYMVRAVPGTVIANGDGSLRAWTSAGKPLWTFARAQTRVELPVIDAAGKRVYVLLCRGETYWGRWPSNSSVVSLVCLDLATGAVAWENTDVASRHLGEYKHKSGSMVKVTSAYGQLVVDQGMVVAFNSRSHSGGQIGCLAIVDAKTGATRQQLVQDMRKIYGDSVVVAQGVDQVRTLPPGYMYNLLIRDGKPVVMNTAQDISAYAVDPATGVATTLFSYGWNARCVRSVATRDWFISGMTCFLDSAGNGSMAAVGRSGCNHHVVPASGLCFFANPKCICITHLDGFFAIAPRDDSAQVPEAQRLVSTAAGRPAAMPPAAPLPATLLTSGWNAYNISTAVDPATVTAAGWSFAIDPQQHRVDASKDGRRWSHVADARVGTQIAVVGDRVVIGGHDGWVRGLDLDTGAERWRYLAAPAQRLIVANGMIASSWPVFGVADLGQGRIVASAGTHAELGGGLRIVALDAATGRPAWGKTVVKSQSTLKGRDTRIVPNSVVNTAPTFADGKVRISGRHHLGTLEFAPDESGEEISARISGSPKGGKR